MYLFGSISSDEEERRPEQLFARNSTNETNNHNRKRSTLELDLSISSDEGEVYNILNKENEISKIEAMVWNGAREVSNLRKKI